MAHARALRLSRLLCVVPLLAAAGARAQAIDGFRIGDRFADDSAGHAVPEVVGQPGAFLPRKWTLPNGTAVSVTTDAATGRIVFIEQDGTGRPTPSALPSLTLDDTRLRDIRSRFGSNGFGYSSTGAFEQNGELLAANCYRLAGTDAVLAVVTGQPLGAIQAQGDAEPDTGLGMLHAVILSDRRYLDRLWGPNELRDPAERPVRLD